jgi:hypothetical protein
MVAGLADPGFDRDKPVEALLDMLGAPAGPGERETA